MPSHESKDFICICGNKYRHHTSLAKHKRNCGNKTIIDDEKTDTSLASELKEMATKDKDGLILKLLKDNEEIRQILKDIIPKIGNNTIINNNNNSNNTTNNFNLNVFLNEQCKDALNISEFVDSLKITFEDLLYSKKNGLVEGISNVMIRGLKELDIYKRPIHCTDKKRETMYIKDHEKWEKDETHEIMRNTIEKIADKERTALQLWTEENPDWIETERKQMEYLTMLRNISEPIEDEAKNGKKIIRAVSREVIVDKKDMDI
jgi:ferritin